MYQVGLGLRSLAIKIAVFILFAGLFAWFLGGSIFPGSQVVNMPSFSWLGENWHAQVTGNGRAPAPCEWRLVRGVPDGEERIETCGLIGTWRSIIGPQFVNGAVVLGAEVQRDQFSTWWLISIDSKGVVVTRQLGTASDLFAALALPTS